MALRNRRNGNLDALQAFAGKFDPPLPITETRAVAGKAVTNGYMTAWHDPESGLGLTAVVWGGGRMKVWVEVDSEVGDADALGEFFADVVKAAVPQAGLEDEEKAWDVQLAQQDQTGVTDMMRGQRADLQAIAEDETCQRCGGGDFIVSDGAYRCSYCKTPVGPLTTDDDYREAAPAGLVSDRMVSQMPESTLEQQLHDPGKPYTYTWKERRADVLIVDDAGNVKDKVWNQPPLSGLVGSEFPNPQRIDMTGLAGSERLTLCSQFPALRFRINADGRKRVDAQGIATPDDGAGFCTAEQLAHVRRLLGPQDRDHAQEPRHSPVPARRSIPRMPAATGGASPAVAIDNEPNRPMHALPKDTCQHQWVRNSIGDGETCAKCQGFRRVNPTRASVASRNAEARLRDMIEAAAQCIRQRGQHSPVMGVCQFCGAEVLEGAQEAQGEPQAAV